MNGLSSMRSSVLTCDSKEFGNSVNSYCELLEEKRINKGRSDEKV